MSPRLVGAVVALAILGIGLPFVLERHAPPAGGGPTVPTGGGRVAPGAPAPAPVLAVDEPATTVEVQEFDQLERELARLQREADAIGREEVRARTLAETLDYLRLGEDEAEAFRSAAQGALADIRAAREALREVHAELASDPASETSVVRRRDAWQAWQRAQQRAADRLLDPLEPTPRHRLFAAQRMAWLLRLDYGR